MILRVLQERGPVYGKDTNSNVCVFIEHYKVQSRLSGLLGTTQMSPDNRGCTVLVVLDCYILFNRFIYGPVSNQKLTKVGNHLRYANPQVAQYSHESSSSMGSLTPGHSH